MIDLSRAPGLVLTLESAVEPHFVDAMGHMNVAFYAQLFDRAVWRRFGELGLDAAYLERERRGMFALEENTRYIVELRQGERLSVHTALLELREKTLRFVQYLENRDKQELAATQEIVVAHIDLTTRRTTPIPSELRARLAAAVVGSLRGATMTEAGAQAFARSWIDAWNRRDVEAVLAHYADDATFVSPRAERITGSPVVEGKSALRAYWQAALRQRHKLEFTLDRALWSPRAETVSVLYRAAFDDQPPNRASEVMRFRGGSIVHGEAFYGGTAEPSVPA
jgi:acyl-CoA thioesterase FadM/ketosteroid isomerase-like protein